VKYWLDTEFIEDGKSIDLISIGIVSEDGREYYCINSDCDYSKASPWVKVNVLPQLRPDDPHKNRGIIGNEVRHFIGADKPEFWGYYADYDWVVFCWLFGAMVNLPKGWPLYCRDIKQFCDSLGNPELPLQGKGEHNALADARWNKKAWYFLNEYRRSSTAPMPTM
jgi:hypothetical protein